MNSIRDMDVNDGLACSIGFDDVPTDAAGESMRAAQSEGEFNAYIEWLADYLYRPSAEPGPCFSPDEAWSELIGIEIEIANWIWTHPYEDYPPEDRVPPSGARHWDILHREAICRVLSRIPDSSTRVSLLRNFYTELIADAHK